MSIKTTFYIIRHGESVGNLNKICLGHTNLGLTERGREQAFSTAKSLIDVSFDKIYSSDLIRAYDTAVPNCLLRGLDEGTIINTPVLRELYFGDWENKLVSELVDKYGDMFTVGWRQNFGTFTPPNGEHVQDCAKRMVDFLTQLAVDNKGATALVVSHAAAIRAMWGRISGISASEVCQRVPFPSNASYSVLEYNHSTAEFCPLEYSVDQHLLTLRTALPT